MHTTNKARLEELREAFKKEQQKNSLIEIIKLALGEYHVDDFEGVRLDDLDIDHVAEEIAEGILYEYNLEVK